jgi:hypothetical protein
MFKLMIWKSCDPIIYLKAGKGRPIPVAHVNVCTREAGCILICLRMHFGVYELYLFNSFVSSDVLTRTFPKEK